MEVAAFLHACEFTLDTLPLSPKQASLLISVSKFSLGVSERLSLCRHVITVQDDGSQSLVATGIDCTHKELDNKRMDVSRNKNIILYTLCQYVGQIYLSIMKVIQTNSDQR